MGKHTKVVSMAGELNLPLFRLEIIPIEHVRDVLKYALVEAPTPVDWDEAAEEAAAAEATLKKDGDGPGATAH